ncbi:Flagellar hook-associated protein FlgL [Candidatus Bealeia paramacronuclearis]|uniref:Flagellar hook-associated protein FlgL n=1 Tax=Candidatus Bealeia paramacronuclearis TaxID=1921001 RepID=A0ABZ2C3U9_9PROT|nr:Flagellar hook-associated protein FlgL [Candidatus Bealeia paramacronuclearis]
MITNTQLPPAYLRGTLNAYSQLTDAQTQVSSGEIAQTLSQSPDAAQEVMINSAQKQWADHKIKLLTQIDVDASTRVTSIDEILESATRISTLIIQANSGGNGLNNSFTENMNQELTTIFQSLNVRNDNGDYLFSGTALNVPPANRALLVNPPTTGSTPDFTWFQGLNDTAITANSSGIEMLLRGAQMAYTASMGPPPDQARLSSAMQLVNQGIQDMSDGILPLTVNAQKTIETGIDSWTNSQINAQNQISSLADASIMEAVMAIQQRSVEIQGAFIANAEIRDAMKALINSIR